MGAGFARMNDLVVIQTSQGLASYILQQHDSSSPNPPSIVIGHDHRYNSDRFARLAATAMIRKGIKVYFYDTLVHTPMVPFGVDYFKASAGVMITASHNPAADNGYKVYWSTGCQIIPPHDGGIAAEIERNLEVTAEAWDAELYKTSSLVENHTEKLKSEYFSAVSSLISSFDLPPASSSEDFKFVYTPMHGVGLPFVSRIASNLSLTSAMTIVPEQAQPNPDFPTVRFPNPEEKGALDLATSLATSLSVPLVLASDPDADRFAAAQYLPDESRWHTFSGNELGILFASFVFSRTPSTQRSSLTMLASAVSSRMLGAMATTEGFTFEETLTGFKWLGSRAAEIGTSAVYAFEEAIGYMFSPVVHDKDGVAAAAVFLSAARHWASQPNPQTPYDHLQSLYAKYGHFASANSYLFSPSPTITASCFSYVRAMGEAEGKGLKHPEMVAGRKVTWWRDLTEGYDSREEGGVPRLPTSKSSEMVTVELEGGKVKFTVRGSGTEPKIKFYVEAVDEDKDVAKKIAEEVAEAVKREWFRPEETGLVVP